jgi:hypothetical protein
MEKKAPSDFDRKHEDLKVLTFNCKAKFVYHTLWSDKPTEDGIQ